MIMKSKLGNVKLFKLIIVIVIGIGIYINNDVGGKTINRFAPVSIPP